MYTGAGNRGLTFRGWPKSVVSILGATFTVVDAELQERSWYFNTGETYYSYLSGTMHSSAGGRGMQSGGDSAVCAGLTLMRGRGSDNGGCIYVQTANATIDSMVLLECQARLSCWLKCACPGSC